MNGIQGDLHNVDADDACFAGLLLKRVERAVVVEMVEPTILNQFGLPAYGEVAGRILRVHDEQADFGVNQHVPALFAVASSIDTYSIVVAPDQAGVGLTVGHHGSQHAMDGSRE